ncbi:hypothetical protein [Limobrevibacterium gyesilva]|uniref:Uncharacterized protein n=1 Tax=Limobrevibacterium gyesilva TaxID=2991712 RepID=A0AA41YSZ5_9PROT|nr:hypothetical protein [Limobrevibacterium gyesilva]MCW3475930.1 hypothetical protein [Limobrevibacterium gyesilva]
MAHQTDAGRLYQSIAEEVFSQEQYMQSKARKSALEIPELALVHLLWRRLVKDQGEIFQSSEVRSSWESSFEGTARVDLMFEVAHGGTTSAALIEFKIRDTETGYVRDLDKLAQNASRAPNSRRFFCALVDEFPDKAHLSGRIKTVQEWVCPNNQYKAVSVASPGNFRQFPTKIPDFARPLECIVGMWEVVRGDA